jgi:hypothetical protein
MPVLCPSEPERRFRGTRIGAGSRGGVPNRKAGSEATEAGSIWRFTTGTIPDAGAIHLHPRSTHRPMTLHMAVRYGSVGSQLEVGTRVRATAASPGKDRRRRHYVRHPKTRCYSTGIHPMYREEP